ncbi:bacillithiol system redox-active protein YtxJ [Ekhidna sp. To15]|uniref:bacillithiol system redox-active protein YtxJ n=1 Tax=Ekhidna sp. To15 TaxID=3395267 RepID=UPI003F52643E
MLGNLFTSKERITLPWNHLISASQLDEIDKVSEEKTILLFKHSTRCSISSMVLNRFERSYDDNASFEPFFLDLITYRDLSNEVATRYGIRHESPQAILIKNGKAIFDASHMGVSYDQLNTESKK